MHNEGTQVGKSRIRKIKTSGADYKQLDSGENNVFYLSLEEAKQAIASKYEFLADRYEQKFPKHSKGIN